MAVVDDVPGAEIDVRVLALVAVVEPLGVVAGPASCEVAEVLDHYFIAVDKLLGHCQSQVDGSRFIAHSIAECEIRVKQNADEPVRGELGKVY